MTVLDDPKEFGRRVAAARGYAELKKPGFAKVMGKSVPTVTRWEKGEVGSIGSTPSQRKALAEQIVEVTGCPPEWFELTGSADGFSERFAALESQVEGMLELLEDQEPQKIQRLRSHADAVRQLYQPSTRPREEPGSGAENA